jgi:hypothetical protein
LSDVQNEQRFAVNGDLMGGQGRDLPSVNAANVPLHVDASAPKQLGVFGVARG